MTRAYDSSGKRTELIRAAKHLFYRQGYRTTTLDNVAQEAAVPLGNVHYYFQTKQSLAEAVIASHAETLQNTYARWEQQNDDPRLRLGRLVTAPLDSVESVIRSGCPHGSLCQELGKLEDSPLAAHASQLLALSIDWAQKQFQRMGADERQSRERAEELVAAVQGTMFLAHTLRSPQLLATQLNRIKKRLDEETLNSVEGVKADE